MRTQLKLKGLNNLKKKLEEMADRARALDGKKLVVPAGQLEAAKRELGAHLLHGKKLTFGAPLTSPLSSAPSLDIRGEPVAEEGGLISLRLEVQQDAVEAELEATWGPARLLAARFPEEFAGAQQIVDDLQVAFLLEWIITREGQRQGVGTALLAHAFRVAESSGPEAYFAKFSADEAEAHASEDGVRDWYRRNGFVAVPETGIHEPLFVRVRSV